MFILSKVMGDNYQAKILEVLIENMNDEFTIPEIIEVTRTSRGSAYSYIRSLAKENILIETRKVGKTQLYKLNLKNSVTKALILLEHDLVLSGLEKQLSKEEELELPYKKEIFQIENYFYQSTSKEIFNISEDQRIYNWGKTEGIRGDYQWKKNEKKKQN